MGYGVGKSKEDKRRKRRSLPYEKKPQADKAKKKARGQKLYKEYKIFLKKLMQKKSVKSKKPSTPGELRRQIKGGLTMGKIRTKKLLAGKYDLGKKIRYQRRGK